MTTQQEQWAEDREHVRQVETEAELARMKQQLAAFRARLYL